MFTKEQAASLLSRYGQVHVLRWFDELDMHGKQNLLTQILSIDFDWLQRVWNFENLSIDPLAVKPCKSAIQKDDPFRSQAIAEGESALKKGRVGMLLVAGGHGTRLNFKGPKGAFPIGPVSKRSLFQIHAQRLLAIGKRYGVIPPFYLMTNPKNHKDTCDFFADNKNFGLPSEKVVFFEQGVVPVVDKNGKLLMSAKDQIVFSANGNGGLFAAMAKAGVFEHMSACGVDSISYIQVDNPLSLSCDPVFVGYHLMQDCEFSCKAILKRAPHERVGNYALVEDHLEIVEYTEIPKELVTKIDSKGELVFKFGNPGLFIWSRDFAEAQSQCHDLPFHRANKKIFCLDDNGNFVEPKDPNGYKFECFALDTLPYAEKTLLLVCDRDEEFAPVKNATGPDSPDTSRELISNLYRKWIKQAGGKVTTNGPIEISPFFALDQKELTEKIGKEFETKGNVFLNDK